MMCADAFDPPSDGPTPNDAAEPGQPAPDGQLLIYEDGATRLQVRLDGQTIWLTQAAMAELYQTTPQNINQHIKTVYGEGELAEQATCKNYLQVRSEGSPQGRCEQAKHGADDVEERTGGLGSARRRDCREELTRLNRIVTMYLDYAEDQAAMHRPMYMTDWIDRLDVFLQFRSVPHQT